MTEREDVEALVRETCRWRTDGNMVSWVEFEDVVDLAEGVRAAERERLAAVPPFPPGLEEIVKSCKINWPGWMVYLGRDNEGGGWPVLRFVSHTPNSHEPGEMIRVNHSFLVPLATYNERTWRSWIFERFVDVWRHECGEFLMFDGVRMFAPHHGNGEDPYRTWYVGDLADTKVRAGEEKPCCSLDGPKCEEHRPE